MVDPSEFPILFGKKWPITGLATELAALSRNDLCREYEELRRCAPNQGFRKKPYLVKGRESTSRDDGNRFEERLAMALCHGGRWRSPRMGNFRVLDRQVPLQAKRADARIGKVDLLGVTDSGRLVVIELKVKPAGKARGRESNPAAALVQGLRYAAIISANQEVIANEAKHLFGVEVSEDPPAVVVLGPQAWWGGWLELPRSTRKAMGDWEQEFDRLARDVEARLDLVVECLALEDVEPSKLAGATTPRLDRELEVYEVRLGAARAVGPTLTSLRASSVNTAGRMRLRIHRGTREIGGTCIEVEAQGRRLVLDVGLPLGAPDDEGAKTNLLPAVPGFRSRDDSLLGVVISHPHPDHYGLAGQIQSDVPIYIGEAAHRMLNAASPYVRGSQTLAAPRFIEDRRPIDVGPFRVTPYLVDHSAFDAYALLVEADGKRVFYSGDFREHGRKRRLFDAVTASPPKDIDVLLMEGTTIGRTRTDEPYASETELENAFVRAFRETLGLHFVWTASQNIDRLVTVFRAAKRARRMLLIDLYTAVVLEATGRNTIPQSSWSDVRLYVPYGQRVQIKKQQLFDDLDRHKANRVFPAALPRLASSAVMLFRPTMMKDHGVQAVLKGASLTYSMWKGYLKQDYSRRVIAWLKDYDIPLQVLHTSGHASVSDLKRFAAAVTPRALVPIHSAQTARFGDFFDRVVHRDDGEWWDA